MRLLILLPVMIGVVLLLLFAAAVAATRMIFQLLLGAHAPPLLRDDDIRDEAESAGAAQARSAAQPSRKSRQGDERAGEMMRGVRN
jgi:hypothetical protein